MARGRLRKASGCFRHEYLIEVILEREAEIQHPEPRRAVALAVFMVSSTLAELIVVEYDMKAWQALIADDDLTLKRELLRSFLTYLGATPG